MGFEVAEQAAIGAAPAVGDKDEPVATGDEGARKRLRREDMPPGSARRKYNWTIVSTRHSASPTRLLVSASNMPMPNDMARSDDPP